MSKTDSLHYQLCLEAAKWLRRRHKYGDKSCMQKPCYNNRKQLCGKCYCAYKWIAVELSVTACENPDVWGYDGYSTAVIEVKVSHADFLADKKKYWRTVDPEYRAGNVRWFLCPEDVIKPEELPEGWGLLYWNGRDIYPVVSPKQNLYTGHADMRILYSILRRKQFKEGIYNFRGRPTTITDKK